LCPATKSARAARCELILEMQADGLAKRLEHAHAKTAVIGISGGLDSCLALLVAARAMRRLHRAPHGHSGRDDAVLRHHAAHPLQRGDPLRGAGRQLHRDPHHRTRCAAILRTSACRESDRSVTFENGQARVRTLELMDTANRTGGLVVGTGDLSELALGWATYNGDHMSMYGVNAGVPKTLVRHIVRYEADIAATPALRTCCWTFWTRPSAPSCCPPRQTARSRSARRIWWGPTSCTIFISTTCCAAALAPPRSFIWRKAAFAGRPEYPDAVLLRWLENFYRRFFAQQFKRSCLPDGPKVGSVTLSPRGDWRMPSDAAAALWLGELETLKQGR
jgi:NAD+ synthase (glutamine-hydrolysing)